jgi:hypothetical protein
MAFAGIALIALLAGCTGAPGQDSAEETPAEEVVEEISYDFTTPVEPKWTVPAALLGPVDSADGYLGAYVEGPDRSMQAVVWDAETGQEMWRDIADPAMGTVGIAMAFSVFESNGASYATYLRPTMGTQRTELIIADLATGAVIHNVPGVFALSRVSACIDDTMVCGYGDLEGSNARGEIRVDVATGEAGLYSDDTRPAGSRDLSADLYVTHARAADGGVEKIGFNPDGTTLWEVPYEGVFGVGYSSDAGFAWADQSSGPITGTGYLNDPARYEDAAYTRDETAQKTIALDPKDGSVVWSLDGVAYCDLATVDVEDAEVLAYCRANSGVTEVGPFVEGAVRPWTTTGFDMDLIGVNVATGEIEWEVPLGTDPANLYARGAVFAMASNQMKLANVDGFVQTIDAVTGATGEPMTEGIVACSIPRERYDTYYPHTTAGERAFVAGDGIFPCDITRAPLAQSAYSEGAIRIAGTPVDDDTFVIGEAAALSVFTVAD